MVDLATLTGAIMVALGTEYAGMFSNNDELAERLSKVGLETGEAGSGACRLARNTTSRSISQFADMKKPPAPRNGRFDYPRRNFLQRFVDGTPWAHLDIAGTAMGAPKDRDQSKLGFRAMAFGCWRRLVAEYYEAKK